MLPIDPIFKPKKTISMNEKEISALLLASPAGQNVLQAIKNGSADYQSKALNELRPTATKGNPVSNVGGQIVGGVSRIDTGFQETITIEYTAPTSGGKWLFIGNLGGLVSRKLNILDKDIADYDNTGSTWDYEAIKTLSIGSGFTVAAVNYQVSGSAQFSQPIIQAAISFDGTVVQKDLRGRVQAGYNSQSFQSNVRVLDLASGNALINRENALAIYVATGVTVNLAITPGWVGS